jgi:hypothetical protein
LFGGGSTNAPSYGNLSLFERTGAVPNNYSLANLGGNIMDGLSTAGQFVNSNPWLVDAAKAGVGMYQADQTADYNKSLLDMYNRQASTQAAERQRQIDKEKEAQASLMTGFGNAGFNTAV